MRQLCPKRIAIALFVASYVAAAIWWGMARAGEVESANLLPRGVSSFAFTDRTVIVRYAVNPTFVCRMMGAPGPRPISCTRPGGETVLPNPCRSTVAYRDRRACHEYLHQLGWPADHPLDWKPQ